MLETGTLVVGLWLLPVTLQIVVPLVVLLSYSVMRLATLVCSDK